MDYDDEDPLGEYVLQPNDKETQLAYKLVSIRDYEGEVTFDVLPDRCVAMFVWFPPYAVTAAPCDMLCALLVPEARARGVLRILREIAELDRAAWEEPSPEPCRGVHFSSADLLGRQLERTLNDTEKWACLPWVPTPARPLAAALWEVAEDDPGAPLRGFDAGEKALTAFADVWAGLSPPQRAAVRASAAGDGRPIDCPLLVGDLAIFDRAIAAQLTDRDTS